MRVDLRGVPSKQHLPRYLQDHLTDRDRSDAAVGFSDGHEARTHQPLPHAFIDGVIHHVEDERPELPAAHVVAHDYVGHFRGPAGAPTSGARRETLNNVAEFLLGEGSCERGSVSLRRGGTRPWRPLVLVRVEITQLGRDHGCSSRDRAHNRVKDLGCPPLEALPRSF